MSAETSPPMPWQKASDLARLIRCFHYRFANEKELQNGLARAFDQGEVSYQREHSLEPGDIIDFLVEGGIGIEVKVGGGLSEVTRQLYRYSAHGSIESLILVSSRSSLDNLPSTMRGKPLFVVVINGAFHV